MAVKDDLAIIKEMLAEKVISGFRGVLDFYYWMGIPCVRTWPRSPGHTRAPAVMAQWPFFSYIANKWNTLPENIRRAYEEMATGTGMTARDMMTRCYLSGFKIDLPPPEGLP